MADETVETIDLTPTWEGILPAYIEMIAREAATMSADAETTRQRREARDSAVGELHKMARLADKYVASKKRSGERTFTLAEEQVSDTIDSLKDRIEQLDENAAATDLHTSGDIAYFVQQATELRVIVAILDASNDRPFPLPRPSGFEPTEEQSAWIKTAMDTADEATRRQLMENYPLETDEWFEEEAKGFRKGSA